MTRHYGLKLHTPVPQETHWDRVQSSLTGPRRELADNYCDFCGTELVPDPLVPSGDWLCCPGACELCYYPAAVCSWCERDGRKTVLRWTPEQPLHLSHGVCAAHEVELLRSGT